MRTSTLGNTAESSPKRPPTDSQLLKRFVASGDGDCFAQIVERHGAYIFGVCRRSLAHAQDAEDVFQACFLELARQASSVCQRESIAAWLQTVAVRMARRARNRRTRRQQRELAGTAKEPAVAPDDTTWLETRRILEEEIGRLPEELRLPIILCFFQGMTQEEASQSLGIKYRTLRARLVRGREILHKRLRRRGVTLAVLGAVLTAEIDGAAVSRALGASTVRAAVALAKKSSLSGVASPAVLSLMSSKPTVVTWIVVIALGLGLGGGATLLRSAGAKVTDAAEQSSRRVPDRNVRTGDEPILLARAADEKQQAADSPAETESRKTITGIAEAYQLYLGDDRVSLSMEREPVLRWPNLTRDSPDGATFLWTLDGRPEAMADVWIRGGVPTHAFHSFSRSKLVAVRNGRTTWHPEKPGIELKEFADAPQPDSSAAKRLGQMKSLARRFTCRITGRGDGEELRLLSRPLYRYKTERKDLFDGALFAFVQGTDPEVMLILEAVHRGDQSAWQYALTRDSGVALEADLDGKRIWNVPSTAGAADEPWFQEIVKTAK